MCGISGTLGRSNSEIAREMTEALAHRGPDGEGFYFSENIALGIRRLNITGPLENDQPIWNEDHTVCIIFNGEIYNFRELRALLETRGHMFSSTSDSEVIMHLYEDYGKDCVQYLKGMFAFAVWDGKKLLLARDRIGIKPLYYSCLSDSTELVFGSEIRAILRHPEVENRPDQRALSELNVLGFVLSPERTVNTMIKQVRPGSTIVFAHENGSITQQEKVYFKLGPTEKVGQFSDRFDMQEAIVELEMALRKSCRAIMNQDQLPKGLYLSGGLDSTVLAVLCSQESALPLHTFTLGDSLESEDIKCARDVAAAIGSIHHEIIVDQDECVAEYPNFLEAYESIPVEGTFEKNGDFAFFLLSKYVAQHVKVAICGEGADELFGGYWMHKWPLGYVDGLRERLNQLDENQRLELTDHLRQWFPQEEDRECYRRGVFDLLLGSGLSNYHLWAVDRASMWYGLEVRVPYLFEDVVQTVNSLPLESKVSGSITKRILREFAERMFDQYSLGKILERTKWAMPDALKNTAAVGSKTKHT